MPKLDLSKNTDLVELDMLHFDIILDMDWLYSCYASTNCRTQAVRCQFPNEPPIEWKNSNSTTIGRFIHYLKARKIISKDCI